MPIFFSIIIPARELNAYLHEETLPAIESQTYRNLEVIIVADNLHTFANEIKLYPFLKLIESSEPPGVKRDLGAKNAGGQVLVFIDDDTAPMPDFLKNANVLFSRNNDLLTIRIATKN